MDSQIDALFTAEPTVAETPASAPTDAGAAAAPAVETPVPETPETPIDPAAPPAEEEEVDPIADELAAEDDTETDAALQEGKATNPLDLASSRGQRIYRSYKAYKDISDAVGQDLTPEIAKTHFESFTDKLAMDEDFKASTPESAGNFLAYWNNASPQGMATMAAQMPQLMLQHNQEAYRALALPVITNYISSLYARAAVEQNKEIKDNLTYTARMAEWDLTGKFRDDAAIAAAPQIDPRAAQIDQRWNQIQAYDRQQQANARGAWEQNLAQTNDSTLVTEADRVLAPLQKALPSAKLFEAARGAFINAVKDHLSKDSEGERAFNLSRASAAQRLSSEDIKTLNSAFAARAIRAIRTLAPAFLKEAGVSVKSQSAQRRTTLEAAQQAGKGPTGSGAPVPQSIVPGTPKQYRSQGEKMEDMLDTLLKG